MTVRVPGISKWGGPATVAAVALSSAPALAQGQPAGYDIDIEFLRPAFGHDGFVGLDVPRTRKDLTFRYGTVLQYQADPLTLYDAVDDVELGGVVTNRAAAMFGASFDISERVTANLLIPTAFNFGSEQPQFAADGFGVGDPGAGVKIVLLKTPRDVFNVGVRAGLIFPFGRDEFYVSESSFRINTGLLAALNVSDSLTIATDLGLMTRTEVRTDEDFTAANEVQWGTGARLKLPDATRTAFTGQILTRSVAQSFLQGGAENALEAIGGLQFYPSRTVTLDVGAGRGLTEGYGTTDLRVLAALLVEIAPPEPPPPIYVKEEPPPPPPEPPPIDPIIEEPPPPVFEEDELAKITVDKIIIRDMIEFVVDTNVLQEKSRPTLQAVADLINENAQIGHLVIEGHASQEGSTDHNYELAESRARRIWEELLELGVAGDRISYRGYGEVRPLTGQVGADDLTEEQLQTNRRVEFNIIRQYEDPADMPDYPESQYLPWNAKVVQVVQPPKPEVEEEEEEEVELDEFGLPIGEDEFEMDVGAPPEEGEDTGDTGDTGTENEEE